MSNVKRFLVTLVMAIIITADAHGQRAEIQQLVLNYQKLAQLKKVLEQMYKGYAIITTGYNKVKDISQGNFNLHDEFLKGLLAVSPAVRNYSKVAEIVHAQGRLVKEYRDAIRRFRQDPHFSPPEISCLEKVYDNLFRRSLKNLDDLAMIITAGTLRMSDEQRLSAIDCIAADSDEALQFLRQFNNSASMLAMQRASEQQSVQRMKLVHGLNN